MAAPSTPRKPSANAVPVLVPAGSHAGKPSLPLGRPFTLIGSRHRAHLHLLSGTVSKSHASIISTDSGLYIRDLVSREHVFVNNQPVREVVLADGDLLRIGSFNFKYKDPAAKRRPLVGRRAPTAELHVDGSNIPLPIDARTMVIGRRPTCDIPLIELSASTIHAIIFESNGQRFIRDLGSRTGTHVNGAPVNQRPLNDNDQIKVGDTHIRYVVKARHEQPIETADAVSLDDELETFDVAPPVESEPVAPPADLTEEKPPTPPRHRPRTTAPPVRPAAKADKGVIPLAGDELLPLATDDDLIPLATEPTPAPTMPPQQPAPPPLDLAAAAESNAFEAPAHADDPEHGLTTHIGTVSESRPSAPAEIDDASLPADLEPAPAESIFTHSQPPGRFPGIPQSAEELSSQPEPLDEAWQPPTEKLSASPAPTWDVGELDLSNRPQTQELVPGTEPTPQSAQSLEPQVSTDEAFPLETEDRAAIDLAPSTDDLSDSRFEASVNEMADPAGEPVFELPPEPAVAENQPFAEAESLVAEAEPQVVNTEPQPVEDASYTNEVQPPVAEHAPHVEESQPQVAESLPSVAKAPPAAIERAPAAAETEPTVVETQTPEMEIGDTLPIESSGPLADAFQSPPVDAPIAPVAHEPDSVTQPVPSDTSPLSEDAAAPMLSSDSEPHEIPHLSALLGEDETTGDPLVDSAFAFLAHESNLKPSHEKAAVEPQPPLPQAAEIPQPEVLPEVQPPVPQSVESSPPLQPELSETLETPAAGESLEASIEPPVVADEQLPLADDLDPLTIEAEIELGPGDYTAVTLPAEPVRTPSEAKDSEPLPPLAAATVDELTENPVASTPVEPLWPLASAEEELQPLEVSSDSPAMTAPQDVLAPDAPTSESDSTLDQLAADELQPLAAVEETEFAPSEHAELQPLDDSEPPTFAAPDVLSSSAPALEADSSPFRPAVEELEPLVPTIEDVTPAPGEHAELLPLDDSDVAALTSPHEVISEAAEPAIAPPPPESTITAAADATMEAPPEHTAPEEAPADSAAFDLAAPEELQPLVEAHPHSEFTDDQAPVIATPLDLEFEQDIVSQPPEAAVAESLQEAEIAPPPAPQPPTAAPVPPASTDELPPLPPASLQDLLSGMSRDAGSFLGGLPLGFTPVVGPAIAPAMVKIKQDAPQPPPPLQPAPIGRVQAEIPPDKIVGVPPSSGHSGTFEDPELLDSVAEELAPIDDVTEIVGEKPSLPPDIFAPVRTAKSPTPPPPARTTRAVTAFDGLDEVDLDELLPLSPEETEQQAAAGAPNAFDGLAMGPTTPVDAFSLQPLSENDDIFVSRAVELDDEDNGELAADDPPPAGTDPAARTPRPPRQPGSQIIPPPGRPQPEPTKKKKKWKFFGSVLLLLCAGGAGAAYAYWPYQVQTIGSLHFDGLGSLQIADEHPLNQGENPLVDRRSDILTPARGILPRAVDIAKAARVDPGFLDDTASLQELAGSSAVDFKSASITFRHRGRDAEAEKTRMASLLLAAYEAGRPLIAADHQRQQDIADIDRQLNQIASDTQKLTERAARAAEQSRTKRQAEGVRQTLAIRDVAVQSAAAKVGRLQAEAARPRPPVSIAPLLADVDPQLIDLSNQLHVIDARLALLSGGSADSAKASQALSAALLDVLKQVETGSSTRPSDADPSEYLQAAQTAAEQIRHAATEFVDAQKTSSDSLADLHRQQLQKAQVRLSGVFAADPQIADLRQKWTIKDRQANTAADAGLADQAARLRADAATLLQQIDRRKIELTPPDAQAAVDQKMSDAILAQMRHAQEVFGQRLTDAARQLSPALSPEKLIKADRATADVLSQKFVLVQAAGQQLAATFGPEPLDSAAVSRDLTEQRSNLASKAEQRRKQIADDAVDRAVAERAQLAAETARRSAISEAQAELTKATADRDTVKQQLDVLQAATAAQSPIDLEVNNAQLRGLADKAADLKAQRAEKQSTVVITPKDPRDQLDSVQTEPLDPMPRYTATAAAGSLGVILMGFCWWRANG